MQTGRSRYALLCVAVLCIAGAARAHKVEHVMSITEDVANEWMMAQDHDILSDLVSAWDNHIGSGEGRDGHAMDLFLETDEETDDMNDDLDGDSDMETASVNKRGNGLSASEKAALTAGFEVSGVKAKGAPAAPAKSLRHSHHSHKAAASKTVVEDLPAMMDFAEAGDMDKESASTTAGAASTAASDREEDDESDPTPEIVEKESSGHKAVLHEINATPAADRDMHDHHKHKHHKHHNKHHDKSHRHHHHHSSGDDSEMQEEAPSNSASTATLTAKTGQISCRTVCDAGAGASPADLSQAQAIATQQSQQQAAAQGLAAGGAAATTAAAAAAAQQAAAASAAAGAPGVAGAAGMTAPGTPGADGASGVSTDSTGKVTQCFKLCLPQCNKNDLHCFTKCVRVCIAYNHQGQPVPAVGAL